MDKSAREKEDQSLRAKQRFLENDMNRYQNEMRTQIQKQGDTISGLKKENEKLKQELSATSGGSYTLTDQDKILELEDEVAAQQRRLHYEKTRETDLEKRYAVMRMHTLDARRTMGGVNITRDNTDLVSKQVTVLENRLDQALVKFNEALSRNKDLRSSIDSLRGERAVFDEIYKKLETELHQKKRQMAEVIERSNKDYEERDALVAQLDVLKAAAREDAKKYDEHFQNLEVMVQEYKAKREQQQQQIALKSPKAHSKPDELTKRNKTQLEPNSMEREVEQTHAEQEGEELQDIIDTLKESTGIQDLDVLYHKFVKAEEHNFSMYNFVNELNSEVELLETELSQLREKLQAERGDAQRRRLLKDLENELARVEQQYESLQERSRKHKDSLQLVCNLTQEIFTKVGCTPQQAEEMLGTSECTELNLEQFLGLVESRTNELLYAYNLAAANEQRRRMVSKDEEARRRRERKQADRLARIEAGEPVPDDDDGDEDEGDGAVAPVTADKAKFVGVGPAVPHGYLNPLTFVMQHGLPNTNAGDPGSGDAADDVEEDEIYSHDVLRQQMEQRLAAKRAKEEQDPRKGKPKARGPKPPGAK